MSISLLLPLLTAILHVMMICVTFLPTTTRTTHAFTRVQHVTTVHSPISITSHHDRQQQNSDRNPSTINFHRFLSIIGQDTSSVNGETSDIRMDVITTPTSTTTPNEAIPIAGMEQKQPALVKEAVSRDDTNSLPVTTGSASSSSSSSVVMGTAKPFVKKKLQTYLRYLEVECWKRSDLRGLESVLQGVASACKQITRIVQRAQTDDVYGVALDNAGNPLVNTNVQGEVQQKLDVLCNTIMLQAFCGSGRDIHAVASEEEDIPRCCSDVMVRETVL
jgi:Fructose-1-6-bisphosphatase, N-terminal domain